MNDFQNLSLFRQHQELLADMVRVDVVLEALAQTTDLRSRWTLNDEAVELIKELMQKLKAHFETETAILRSEFFEEERPLLRDALREIAEEHPDLLRSEEHTSELQSRENLVCRLLLEKKK